MSNLSTTILTGEPDVALDAAAAPAHPDALADGGDVLVPVLADAQRQGDLFIWPAGLVEGTIPSGDTRDVYPSVDVIDGGTARNNHTLIAVAGAASWTSTRDSTGLAIGILTVADGQVAYLSRTYTQFPAGVQR